MKILFMFFIILTSCQSKKEVKTSFHIIDFLKYHQLEILEYTYDSDSYPGIKEILKNKDQIKNHLLINGSENFKFDAKHFSDTASLSACFHPHHTLLLRRNNSIDIIDICFMCRNFSFNQGPIRELKNQKALIKTLNKHGFNINENN